MTYIYIKKNISKLKNCNDEKYINTIYPLCV